MDLPEDEMSVFANGSTDDSMAATQSELMCLRTVTTILMTVMVALVNVAMGASMDKVELTRQWRVPSGVLVGVVVQFIIFPLIALGIAHMFKLPAPYTTGMMLVSICPGGPMANVVTFFVEGNLSLCATMVLVTTLVSMGYVPVLLLILTHGSSSGPVAVSLWAVAIAVVVIALPLILGVLIRSHKESWAQFVVVLGISGGLLAFTANSLLHLIIHTHVFHAPVHVYVATLMLPVFGFAVTFLVAYVFGQDAVSRHTLAIQAAFHNTSLALIILTTTFAGSSQWKELVVVPALYGPITGVMGIIYIVIELVATVCCGSEDDLDNDRSRPRPFPSSTYLPIDEPPRGNGEYMALEGDDDDNNTTEGYVEISRRRSRLRMGEYEVMKGTVYPVIPPLY